jgi:hypothetical protein
MKTICAIAMTAFVLMSASAGAGTTVSTTTTATNCKKSAYGPQTCTTMTTKNDDSEQSTATPKQKTAAEIRREQEEAEARIRQWEAFCRPTKAIDKFGITRLSYAHEGCEFGISQDTESFAQVK